MQSVAPSFAADIDRSGELTLNNVNIKNVGYFMALPCRRHRVGENAVSQPTISNYLEASSFTYNSGLDPTSKAPVDYSGTFAVKTNHYASTNAYDAYNPRTGLYGAAFTLGTGDQTKIVISFEGTNLAVLGTQTQFAVSEIRADYRLYKGQLPAALVQAARFTKAVIAQAAAQGISKDDIFVTGHSLGAAEAEYADVATGLRGATFGTPGISSDFVPPGSTSGLTNYVEDGDPVGNYAYTGPASPEGAFIYSDKIGHFGATKYIGHAVDSAPLYIAGAAYGTGKPALQDAALALLLGAAAEFHPISVYADTLHHPLINPPAGATSFDNQAVSAIVGAIAARHG